MVCFQVTLKVDGRQYLPTENLLIEGHAAAPLPKKNSSSLNYLWFFVFCFFSLPRSFQRNTVPRIQFPILAFRVKKTTMVSVCAHFACSFLEPNCSYYNDLVCLADFQTREYVEEHFQRACSSERQ